MSLTQAEAVSNGRKDSLDDASSIQIIPTEWEYRVEGGQHLVFAYKGSNTLLQKKILRLRSVKKGQVSCAKNKSPIPFQDEALSQKSLNTTALRPYLLQNVCLTLDKETAYALGQRAQPFRPVHRTLSNFVPLEPAPALIQDDLALLFGDDTLCVEVKVKSACVSRSRLVPPDDCHVLNKFTLCDLHVRTRTLEQLRTARASSTLYDPADFISGDKTQIDRALAALRKSKSRYLRILRGGEFFAATNFIANKGVKTTLAYNHPTSIHALEVAAKALAQSNACLHFLRRMQLLDYIDRIGLEVTWTRLLRLLGAEEAAQVVWKNYLEAASLQDGTRECPQLTIWKRKISYSDSSTALREHNATRHVEALNAVAEMPADVCARVVADFMLSAVAKDCSLLVSIAPVNCSADKSGGVNILREENGTEWMFEIHVIDLGPKPLSKIQDWADQDRKLADAARKTKEYPNKIVLSKSC